jgi:cytochrome P450
MNCPGKGLAQLELRVVVATLVQKFDMELEMGYDRMDWEKNLDCYFVLTRGVLPVKLKMRAT